MPAPQASEPCQDLIDRLLTADPAGRATMAEVLAHPWVAAGMPPELASLNDRLLEVPIPRPWKRGSRTA